MKTPRPEWSPKLSVVTGASGGLGKAFAERLAANGSNLVLTARNQERLRDCADEIAEKYPVSVQAIATDLSLPDSPQNIFEEMNRLGLTADVLINNAGFNVYGRFEDSNLDRELEMLRLQVIATTQLTKLFLRGRDRNQRNKILNVSSLAAFVPGPFVSVHFASRAHLLNFSLALSEEFRGTDVHVTCLCPGPMQTGFFDRAGMTDVRLASNWPLKLLTPSEVGSQGYDAMISGRQMVVPGMRNRLFGLAARLAPFSLRSRFTKWIMDRT